MKCFRFLLVVVLATLITTFVGVKAGLPPTPKPFQKPGLPISNLPTPTRPTSRPNVS